MKKGCGSASLWGNGYRGRRPETGISRNLELRHLGKCVLFSWLAPPKAGGELALAPERGIVGRKEAPLRRFATPPPPCGARKTHRAYADPRVFRPLRNGKHIGLTLILVFSDRCGKSTIASSAPDSAMALFPRRGERQVRKAAILRARGRLRAAVSPSHRRTPSVTATSRRDSSPGGGARGSPCGQSRPCARIRSSPQRSILYSLFLIPYSLFLLRISFLRS